ncbi:MAG: RnfABCDGE type electron transport complex subunit D [Clostridiales Family XIII bacterium]|nr:RnfABCDGE type electron transport complex subunit D [Clostridiales Family XIII bacterium]
MREQTEAREKLISVSTSPYIHSGESISKIMWTVVLALAPAAIFGAVYFGPPALFNIVASVAAAVGTEYAIQRLRKVRITAFDGSAFLTGLLLAMSISPRVPCYMAAAGAVIAIAVAKQSMGGLGFNIFNPAHIGRAALMVSWPIAMTSWPALTTRADVVTSATPLAILKQQGYPQLLEAFGGQSALYKAMFLGTRNGSIGETCTLLLLLGGAFVLYKGYIGIQTPLCMIGTVGILTWIFGPDGFFTGDGLFHMMAGGLVIGAFFMATDMVTIPITKRGRAIFAVGAGMITTLIRLKGGYPEGVCYSILLMNGLTPLIDLAIKPRIYGTGGRKSHVGA